VAAQIRARPALIVTAMVAAWCGLVVPLSRHDLGLMLAFLAVVFVGLRTAHREHRPPPRERQGCSFGSATRRFAVCTSATNDVVVLGQRRRDFASGGVCGGPDRVSQGDPSARVDHAADRA
jgi:hypothetical protein